MEGELERFLALVRRELGCEDVRVLAGADDASAPAESQRAVRAELPDGRFVWAVFPEPPADPEARTRRLEMLVSTFDELFEPMPPSRRSRPQVTSSLQDELAALSARAAALNAIVIDANSPVVWGAAQPDGLVPPSPLPAPDPEDSAIFGVSQPANDEPGESRVRAVSRHALAVVRSWEDLAALRRGGRLRRAEREGDAQVLAHSFAGIYVLVLAFGAAFDELRAERAALDALPRIERLVLALPPLDPEPSDRAGAIAIKRQRRR